MLDISDKAVVLRMQDVLVEYVKSLVSLGLTPRQYMHEMVINLQVSKLESLQL